MRKSGTGGGTGGAKGLGGGDGPVRTLIDSYQGGRRYASQQHVANTHRDNVGLDAIVGSLLEFPDDAERLAESLRALALLAAERQVMPRSRMDGNWSVALRRAGGIESIVQVLRRHANHSGVRIKGCMAIAHVAEASVRNQKALGEAGAVEAVANALQNNPTHSLRQTINCLSAMSSLAVDSKNNQVLMLQAGVVDLLVAAIKDNQEHADVQARACLALSMLSADMDLPSELLDQLSVSREIVKLMQSSNLSSAMIKAGAIEAIARALKRHPTHAGVQTKGLMAIANLAYFGNTSDDFRNLGGLEILVEALESHPTHMGVQNRACAAVANLVGMNAATRRAFIPLVPIILTAAVQTLEPINFARRGREPNCLAAIANLASEDVQAQRAIEQAGGLIVVSGALRQYPKDEGVQVYGCQTLVNIVEAKDHKLLLAVRKATMPDLGHCFRPASSIDP